MTLQPTQAQTNVAAVVKISELQFSDLYLGHPELADRFSDVPGTDVNPLPAGPSLQEDLRQLTAACHEKWRRSPDVGEFKLTYDGVGYRVSIMPAQGGNVFVVRKLASTVSSLAALGIPQAYIRRMMMRDLSGLFIISGPIKAGKTMTAGAMLKDRLVAHGGVAVTAENPIELPLEGSYGNGICFQTTLPREPGHLADVFCKLKQWRAGTILIGEIRDEESATELLKASYNGHLVITTMLAENVIQTVTRLHTLVSEKHGSASASPLLADGLLGVLHQHMVRAGKHAPKLETEFLFLRDAPATRAVLRRGEFDLLKTEIHKHMHAMISENISAHRPTPD